MISSFIVLGVIMTLAIVWNVWKYRRDVILGIVAWLAVRYYERRR